MNENSDFSKNSMFFNIIRQSIPLIGAQFAQLLYSIVDRIFIGRIPNSNMAPLSGLGITFPLITFILALTLLFGLGGTPLFSMERGRKNNQKASLIMGNSFTLLLLTSVIVTILVYISMKPLLYTMGASNETFEYANKYLSIYMLGTPFLMLGSGMNYYITAQGYPKTAMLTVLIGAILNTLLDPLFIFVFNLGILGAAIATIISQVISFLWVAKFFMSKYNLFPLTFENIKLNKHISFSIFSLGITNFTMETTNSIVQFLVNKTLKTYGGDDFLAIMTAINSTRAILNVIITAITSGAQPVLSYNYGAKLYKRVREGIIIDTLIGGAYTALMWIILTIYPGAFLSLFIKKENISLVTLGIPYVRIYFMAYIFMALQLSGQSTFLALGKTKPAIFFSIFRKLIIVAPLTMILPLFMNDKIAGVFYAEPISNVIGGSASFIAMYFLVYRKLKNMEKTLTHAT